LTGEGQGEGEESGNFKKLFIPLPFIPSRQGRENLPFYETIKVGGENRKYYLQGVKDLWVNIL